VPKSHQDMVAAVFCTIFAQPDAATVASTWNEVRDQLGVRFPKITPLMDSAQAEVLAFSAVPRTHWVKIWSTNPLERINKESGDAAESWASSPTKPPSSDSSVPSSPTCTTSGKPATAATSPAHLDERLYPTRDTDHIAELKQRRRTPRINLETPPPRSVSWWWRQCQADDRVAGSLNHAVPFGGQVPSCGQQHDVDRPAWLDRSVVSPPLRCAHRPVLSPFKRERQQDHDHARH